MLLRTCSVAFRFYAFIQESLVGLCCLACRLGASGRPWGLCAPPRATIKATVPSGFGVFCVFGASLWLSWAMGFGGFRDFVGRRKGPQGLTKGPKFVSKCIPKLEALVFSSKCFESGSRATRIPLNRGEAPRAVLPNSPPRLCNSEAPRKHGSPVKCQSHARDPLSIASMGDLAFQ